MDAYHIQAFNDHYNRGTTLLKSLVMIEGNSPNLGFLGRWKVKKGIRELEKALQIHPESWQSNFFLGKAWQALQNKELAIHNFEQASRLAPQDYNSLREISYEFMVSGEGDSAEKYARAALALAPENDALHCNLALALVINGKIDEAVESIRIAVTLNSHPINANTEKMLNRIVRKEIKPFRRLKRDGSITIEPI